MLVDHRSEDPGATGDDVDGIEPERQPAERDRDLEAALREVDRSLVRHVADPRRPHDVTLRAETVEAESAGGVGTRRANVVVGIEHHHGLSEWSSRAVADYAGQCSW